MGRPILTLRNCFRVARPRRSNKNQPSIRIAIKGKVHPVNRFPGDIFGMPTIPCDNAIER